MNRPSLTIRMIEEKDRESWSRLRTELWPETDDEHLGEIQEYFAGTSIDIEIAFVAESGSVIAGFIEINVRNFAEGSRNPKVPYVEGWIVDSAFRGRGIGKALMRQAEQWAVANGYLELASDAELENEDSIAAHKRLGFKETERVVCFIKALAPQGNAQ